MFDDVHKGRLADMAKRIDNSDVVLMVEVVAIVFRDFIGEVVWVEANCLMAFVIGLDRSDLCVPGEDFVLSCVRNQAFRPLRL